MGRFLTPARAVGAAAMIAFAAAALTAVVGGVPVPQIHDEASYLLAGDTFTHGRLTNPTHPLWPHFETFYVLQRPTYMSRYPPGQGLMLALGRLLGNPIIGIWISAALACAAMTWALLRWLSVPWALAGGILTALHPTMLEWSHSYWGGSVALIGGALAVGASQRLNTNGDSVLLGLGIVILANSRPFEGAILAACLIAALVWRRVTPRLLIPAAVIVVAGVLFMLADNRAVTGNAFRLPWIEYERQYGYVPPVAWGRLHPVNYRIEAMRRMTMDLVLPSYEEQHTIGGFLGAIPSKLAAYVNGALQFIPDSLMTRTSRAQMTIGLSVVALAVEILFLAPFFLLGRILRRDVELRLAAVILVLFVLLALLPTLFPQTQYAAPIAPLFLLLWLSAIREIFNRGVAIVLGAIWIAGFAVSLVAIRLIPLRWGEVAQHEAVIRSLHHLGGAHLVIVRYTPEHELWYEWVQNGAEIDAQRIVWAHDLGDDAALLRYFADRTAWMVIAGPRHPRLIRIVR
jgi:hypothetical protein